MRSLSFNVPGMFDKIISGEKTVTLRFLYIPDYVEGDYITLKERLGEWKEKRVGRTALAKIIKVFPVRVKNISDAIATREGFNNKDESIAYFKKKGLRMDQWLIGTNWKLVKNRSLSELK